MLSKKELHPNWEFLKYKRGGEEFLRIGQQITFKYFSAISHEVEENSGKVIDKTYHPGHYVVQDKNGSNWIIYKGNNCWYSSNHE